MSSYADLADLKNRLNITKADHDSPLQISLTAASRQIDKWSGRRDNGFALDAAVSARTYRPNGRIVRDLDGERLLIDELGSVAGLVVETGSGITWSAVSGVEVGPENALALGEPVSWLGVPFGYWVIGPTVRVRVTARWGWPAIPPAIVEATLLQAARLYRRKDSPEGVVGSAEWGAIRVSRLDPDVAELVQSVGVLPGFGGPA